MTSFVVFVAVLVALFSAMMVVLARIAAPLEEDVRAGRDGIRDGADELMKMVVEWGAKKDGGLR